VRRRQSAPRQSDLYAAQSRLTDDARCSLHNILIYFRSTTLKNADICLPSLQLTFLPLFLTLSILSLLTQLFSWKAKQKPWVQGRQKMSGEAGRTRGGKAETKWGWGSALRSGYTSLVTPATERTTHENWHLSILELTRVETCVYRKRYRKHTRSGAAL